MYVSTAEFTVRMREIAPRCNIFFPARYHDNGNGASVGDEDIGWEDLAEAFPQLFVRLRQAPS